LFLKGYPELALRLQRDFDTLWAGSKDVVYDASLGWDTTSAHITDDIIAAYEDENSHAYFTSVNFVSNGNGGWSWFETTAVTAPLAAAIRNAESSIGVSSAHFVSPPIAQAGADTLAENLDLDRQVVLGCQEVSKYGPFADRKAKIEAAGARIAY